MTKIIGVLKNILPVSIFLIGKLIELVGKLIVGIANVLYNISATLHTQLGTETGLKLKKMEETVASVLRVYSEAAQKVTQSGKESDRLANIVKNDVNVVQLGKKKNEDTES